MQTGNPAHIFSRSNEPYDGIVCGGGPGSALIDDCKAALDELKAANAAGKNPSCRTR